MNRNDFGLRLKELRISHGLTQSQLANKIETTRQAYMNYELGRCMPSAEAIAKLSQILGADLMEMLYSHTTYTFAHSKGIMECNNREEFFEMFELYSKLSPLSRKRIISLMNLLVKGGDK